MLLYTHLFYVILYAYIHIFIYKIFEKGSIKINAKVGISKLDIEQAYLLSYDQLKFAFFEEREREVDGGRVRQL